MNGGSSVSGRALALLVAIVFVLDQGSKYAVDRFTPSGSFRVLVPGFLNLVHTSNPGVAFGLLADSRTSWLPMMLIVFSVAVIALLAWLLFTGRAGGWLGQCGLALILGGAVGNVLDRLLRSSVTDFIDFHVGNYHWYTFNVADSAIVIGAAFVGLEIFRDWRQASQARA